ncbi:MAG: sigma-70 family RNA polymerase sigma factor [Acidobacteriota bacterium]
MAEPSGEITDLLIAWSQGDEASHAQLMPLVYERLKRLAGSFLRAERGDHTLQTTALVHEAYLRLVRQDRVVWRDRAHFLAIAGQMMRRILVDHARRMARPKHGGDVLRLPLDSLENVTLDRPREVLALDEALQALAKHDPALVQVVELRFFGGLTKEEAAAVLGIGTTTVTRRLRAAKAWLHKYLVEGKVIDL